MPCRGVYHACRGVYCSEWSFWSKVVIPGPEVGYSGKSGHSCSFARFWSILLLCAILVIPAVPGVPSPGVPSPGVPALVLPCRAPPGYTVNKGVLTGQEWPFWAPARPMARSYGPANIPETEVTRETRKRAQRRIPS